MKPLEGYYERDSGTFSNGGKHTDSKCILVLLKLALLFSTSYIMRKKSTLQAPTYPFQILPQTQISVEHSLLVTYYCVTNCPQA